jgi:hypothetical protein
MIHPVTGAPSRRYQAQKGTRMTTKTKYHPENPARPGSEGAALLNAEIEFWKEIIETCPVSQSWECVERMHQALALAEHKLAKLEAMSRTEH